MVKVGLYNKAFQMASEEILEEKLIAIRKDNYRFALKAGPMVFNGHTYNDVYVLEIHYKGSFDFCVEKMGAASFGSLISQDFGEAAETFAQEYLSENGWTLSEHLNSWPEYQAIICRDKKEN